MKCTYISYLAEVDPEAKFHVLSALDNQSRVIAVVSEARLDVAEAELIKVLLHLFGAEASQGHNRLVEFPDTPPQGPFVALAPTQVIAIRLKLARGQANLRQADMAGLLGITQQTYAKLERPGSNPTLQTLAQIERSLGRELLCWA